MLIASLICMLMASLIACRYNVQDFMGESWYGNSGLPSSDHDLIIEYPNGTSHTHASGSEYRISVRRRRRARARRSSSAGCPQSVSRGFLAGSRLRSSACPSERGCLPECLD